MKKCLSAFAVLAGLLCLSCTSRNVRSIMDHKSTIEQLVDAAPEHLKNPIGWSEDILTVSNCIRTNGAPRDTYHRGDTLTLVYGKGSDSIEMVYVRDTLYCEILD